MKQLNELILKKERLVIGLMSGTSLDGIDAALVRITGSSTATGAELLAFITVPYSPEIRDAIRAFAQGGHGGSYEFCRLNSLIGQMEAEACFAVCEKAGLSFSQIDLVGSHGQTVFHMPSIEEYYGRQVSGTLQLGNADYIAEALDCVVVSDFRTRDMAAGGQGAPLVPYTEYLLYRSTEINIALQNIGGIGNITVLPANCRPDEVLAFDTGPGNILLDSAVHKLSGGLMSFDENGALAQEGLADSRLENWLLERDSSFLKTKPPKSTGREYYNDNYVYEMLRKADSLDLSDADIAATIAKYTATTIKFGLCRFSKKIPDQLIVSGGGAHNPAIMCYIAAALPDCQVLTGDEAGMNSDAKEAIAFAILANETIHGLCGNLPAATGAKHGVVLGKITI